MMDGNLTLQAVISEKANTILKDGNNSMSLFQLYKSVTSVLNQQIQEESFNMSLQTNTRKEVSENTCFLAVQCHIMDPSYSLTALKQ